MMSTRLTDEGRRTAAPISRALVVAPATRGSGGLGSAAAEFADGIEALGCETTYIGLQPRDPARRIAESRPFRRSFGMASSRRLTVRAVRRAVPRSGWELAYSIPGAMPEDPAAGLRVIYQATRHPAVEWSALQRGERETGGRGDMSTAERRQREAEIERADLIHVTSRAVQEEMLSAGVPPERLVHSYHGVDLDRFSPGPKQRQPTIAFVGPLSLRKGVDVVADLARELRGKWTVEAVGGPTCPWSKRISARADFVRRPSVPETLRAAHVLALPSRSDGFSFVVLEALASGTIPIVTPEVGAAEIVRQLDGRLVLELGDFVEGTAELLPQLDLDALSSRARTLAEEFDRRRTSLAVATAVLERAGGLLDARASGRR
jgi:glycosyltransferase involved in cell wall biosynthesis